MDIKNKSDCPCEPAKVSSKFSTGNSMCPFDSCIMSTPYQAGLAKRNSEIKTLSKNGIPVSKICIRYKLSKRTIYRILDNG